jgi:two-component system, LytTR family, response regulator
VRSSSESLASESPALGGLKGTPIRVLLAAPDVVTSTLIGSLLEDEPNVTLERVDESGLVSSIHKCAPDLVILDAHALSISEGERLDHLKLKPPSATVVTNDDAVSASPFSSSATDLRMEPRYCERLQPGLNPAKPRIVRTRMERETYVGQAKGESIASGHFWQRLAIEEDDKIVLVQTADIEWIQSLGNYLRLHVGDTCHQLRQTLKMLQAQLDPRCFLRVHRNAIVNLDHVEEFHLPLSGNMFVRMRNGACLPLRKGSRTLLRKMLARASY